jgi:hypothetical protein
LATRVRPAASGAASLVESPPPALRVLAVAAWPVRKLLGGLDGLVAVLDRNPVSNATGAVRVRRGLAALITVFAVIYEMQSALHGSVISPVAILMLMVAFAVYTNRGGRFLRDWVPVVLVLVAYGATVSAVPSLGLGIHYLPQIDADRVLGFGTLPTAWLQDHLYQGATGPLEVFSVAMYLSHFIAPLLLAFLIWAAWNGRGFADLLFGLLVVSILGSITFLLAPTAPPWLAAEQGLIAPIHPIIKDGLIDLHLNTLAAHKGDASSYNVAAAIPSLHVAWPVLGLLVIRKHRLPRWLLAVQSLLTAGVVFAVVYTGEHYLVDAVFGVFYALAAWWLLQRALGAGHVLRAAAATSD